MSGGFITGRCIFRVMKTRLKAIAQRITRCLVIGFVTSWVVAWGASFTPHFSPIGGFNSFRGVASFPDGDGGFYSLRLEDNRWLGVKEESYSVHGTTQERASTRGSYPTAITPSVRIWWTLEYDQHHPDQVKRWRMLELRFRDMNRKPNQSSFSVVRYGFPFLSHEAQGAVHRLSMSGPQLNGNEYQMLAGAFSRPLSSMKLVDGFSRNGSPATQFSLTTTKLATRTLFPYNPIWAGLALNTIFFAIVIPLVYSTPRAFRHARRMHKGLCPMCKYDLVYNNTRGCPECGWRKGSSAVESE